jgi:hypothetical protein
MSYSNPRRARQFEKALMPPSTQANTPITTIAAMT